jgi:4-amino-4-deoxychorismate lyase
MARRYKPYAAKKYKQGFRACIYSFRQNENYFLGRMKSTNYLFYQLAYSAAKKKKFDESVILNHRGYICEGSRSNIFWIKDDILFTPALECGCLDGITRKVIFDLARKYNFLIFEGNFTLQNLHKSDGAFLSNSLMGIMPLTCLERQPIAKGFVDKTTKFLMQKYNSLLRHEI